MATGYESVPQGRVNTGGAVVFDTTESTGALAGNLAALINKPLIEQALKQKRVAELGKSYATGDAELLKPSKGTMFTSEINQILAKHLKKGAAYKAAGFDVYHADYSKPDQVAASEDYMKERNQIMSMIGTRDKVEEWQNSMVKSYDETKHDPESLAKLKSFFEQNNSGTRLQELFFKGTDNLPTLSARFNQQTFDNNIKVEKEKFQTESTNPDGSKRIETTEAVNPDNITKQVKNAYGTDPLAKKSVEKEIGTSLDKIYGTTDVNRLREITKAYLTTDPRGISITADAGISDYNGEAFKKLLEQQTDEQLGYEKKFDNRLTRDTDNLAAQHGSSKTWRDDYQKLRYNLSLRNANKSAAGDSTGIEAPQNKTLYFGQTRDQAVTGTGVVKLSLTKRSFQGSEALNLTTNRYDTIKDVASKYEVATVGNYPIANQDVRGKGGLVVKKGELVGDDLAKQYPQYFTYQPKLLVTSEDGENYLIDPKHLPKNKLTKRDLATLETFVPGGSSPSQKQGQPGKTAKPVAMGGYKIGQVEAGYEYLGGDPTKQENWRKK